jgi:hypothetical protein
MLHCVEIVSQVPKLIFLKQKEIRMKQLTLDRENS